MASIPQTDRDVDQAVIESFVRRGVFETQDFHSFWNQFVSAFTRELHRLPLDEPHRRWKTHLATYWLRAFLANFYEDSSETFYWKPGKLREAVYASALNLGLQILPLHPYSPAPDPRRLPDSLWNGPAELTGLRIDLEKSCALVRTLAESFRAEYRMFPFERPADAPPWSYCTSNGFYDSVDGYVLYSMIRQFRPRRIIEIGSGNSTYLAAQAAARNREDNPSADCEIIAIEPYPNPVLRAGFPGLSRLIPQAVQEVPLSLFQQLSKNDILFIDSSHVVRTGSDVIFEILEILPRLSKGVLIHFHDIFLPLEYPRPWVLEMNRYWTEQYLLQSFLSFNESFEVLIPTAFLCAARPEVLEESFPGFERRHGWVPCNFWIQKVR